MQISNKIKNGKKQHRKYHRISTFTPDQQAFIKYLVSRGYDLTLKVFQEEIQEISKLELDWLQKIQSQGKNINYQQFSSWINQLKKVFNGKPNQFVKLQFMLIVWFCCRKSTKISKQSIGILRSYIQKNGLKLSQFPQTLPYFALPYIPEPSTHPFLSKIYTKQWRQQVQKLFKSYCSAPKQKRLSSQQNQWFSVVKDLIQICTFFGKQSINKTPKHFELLQKVNKYKKVIQQNDTQLNIQDQSIKPSELSRLVYAPDYQPQENINQFSQRSVQSVISGNQIQFKQICYQKLKKYMKNLKYQNAKDQKQACIIYYALNERILNCGTNKAKKKIINQYINNDILLIRQTNSLQKTIIQGQLQSIKLAGCMCASSKCVKYLAQSDSYIKLLCQIITKNKDYLVSKANIIGIIDSRIGNKNQNINNQQKNISFEQQKLLQTLSILQKISFNKQAVKKCIRNNLIATLIDYLNRFEIYPHNVLTYILAIILNIILQKQGKSICSIMRWNGATKNTSKSNQNIKGVNKISLFELVVKIWQFSQDRARNAQAIASDHGNQIQSQQQIQSIIYSIFYVLLGVQENKKIAKSIHFKQTLQQFLYQNNDQYHIKVVEHMMEVLDRQEDQSDLNQLKQSIQDQSDSFQQEFNFDTTNNGYVWVGSRLQPLPVQNTQLILQQFFMEPTLTKENQNNLIKNISAPLKFENKEHQYLKQKQQNMQEKPKVVNSSQMFTKVEGYDPSKYMVWKRLKTSKN